MRAQPACSLKLTTYLNDLRTKENLELLRAPLLEYKLFDPDKDPDVAVITAAELKKLVRHWKLHEARGFWKLHPNKEDLVRALLEYMTDKSDQLNFPLEPLTPAKPLTSRPSKTGGRGATMKDMGTFGIGLPDYNGDLFGQTHCTGGLVYLSRHQHRGDNMLQSSQASNTARGNFGQNTFTDKPPFADTAEQMPAETSVIAPDTEDEPNGVTEVSIQDLSRTQTVISQLYAYTLLEGHEQHIVKEGALGALKDMAGIQSSSIIGQCGASLCNLACADGVSKLILEKPGLASEVSRVVASSSGQQQLCWAYLLLNLSAERHFEDYLVSGALQSTTSLASVGDDDFMAARIAVATLANVACTDERETIIDKIKATCPPLVKSENLDAWLILTIAIHNLSLTEAVLPILIDNGGAVVILKEIIQWSKKRVDPMPSRHRELLCYTISKALSNMSCSLDNRKLMIKDGAVPILKHIVEMEPSKEVQEICATAVMNLTNPSPNNPSPEASFPHQQQAVTAGAVDTLVLLADTLETGDGLYRVAVGLFELTACPDNLQRMVSKNAHIALMKLVEKARMLDNTDVQEQAVSALCNMLQIKSNQMPIVENGVVKLLAALIEESQDTKFRSLCTKTISNLTPSLGSYNIDVHKLILQALSQMATEPEVEMKAICATAFASFSSFDDDVVLQQMINFDVPSNLRTLITCGEARVLLQCAATFDNLAKHPKFHTYLYEQGCLDGLSEIATATETDTLLRCASALKSLSSSPQDFEGLVNALATLNKHTIDQAILTVSAEALFILACNEDCRSALASNTIILKQLFGMMRGGMVDTQLCAARALCNLSRDPVCAKTVLAEDIVDDFIVIAILRTNNENEDVKAVCAETLFNLLHADEHRQKMVEKDVLWAVIKLSKVESKFTQRVAMLVLYNLSCLEESRATVINLGIGHVLKLVSRQKTGETSKWAAAMLQQLAWNPEHAKLLVHEGVIGTIRDLIGPSIKDNACMVYYAKMLYCMSLCDTGTLKKMVQDGADFILAEFAGNIGDTVVTELTCIALYNIACNEECQVILAEHQIADTLIRIITGQLVQNDKIVHIIMSIIYKLTCRTQNEVTVANAGATTACSKFANHDNAAVVEICSKILLNLATVEQNHGRLVADGLMVALPQLMGNRDLVKDAMTTLSLISSTVDTSGDLINSDVIPMMQKLLPSEDVQLRRECALIIRNLTCSAKCRSTLIERGEVVPFLEALVTDDNEDVFSHCAVALFNLLNKPNPDGLPLPGTQTVLTKLYKESRDETVKKACGISLVKIQGENENSGFKEGSVLALLESLDANEDDRNAIETGPSALQGGPFLVESFDCIQNCFQSSSPPSIKTEENIYLADEPRWVPFEQALTALKDSECSTLGGLESNICHPPRMLHSHAAGTQIKIVPVKKKVTYTRQAPHSEGIVVLDDEGGSVASADYLEFSINFEVDAEKILESLES